MNKFPSALKLAKVKGSFIPESKSKTSLVKPSFKKGRKTNVSNYRPISLLPLLSKVIEKVVPENVSKFLNGNKIFYINLASEVTIQQTYFCHLLMIKF